MGNIWKQKKANRWEEWRKELQAMRGAVAENNRKGPNWPKHNISVHTPHLLLYYYYYYFLNLA